MLLYIFSLPSSSLAFAFRRRLHRLRIFCFRSDRPITFILLPPTIVSVSSSLAWLGYCPLSHTYTRVINSSARCGQSAVCIDWICPVFRSVHLVSIEFEPTLGPPTIFSFLVPAALAIRICLYIASRTCFVLGRQFTYERIRDT